MKKILIIFAGFLLSLPGFAQWSLTGNAGTLPPANFIGTTDTQRLVFKTGSIERATIATSGNVGIGTTAPSAKLQVYSTTADTHLDISGAAPSIWFYSALTRNTHPARIGFATGTASFVSTAHTGDFIIQNTDTAASLIFGTSQVPGNGLERMRIDNKGYVGISTTTPAAKLDINCVAVSGQGNPSNIRFQNLQGGAGSVLVIDSNGYVYKSTTTAARAGTLTTDLQSEVEALKAQVQELRELIMARQPASPQKLNALAAESATWLGDNTPNPYNGETAISYSLPATAKKAAVQVYSLDGRLLNSINLGAVAGKGQVKFSSGNLAAGMYIYSLVVDGKVADTKKMVIGN